MRGPNLGNTTGYIERPAAIIDRSDNNPWFSVKEGVVACYSDRREGRYGEKCSRLSRKGLLFFGFADFEALSALPRSAPIILLPTKVSSPLLEGLRVACMPYSRPRPVSKLGRMRALA